MNMIKKEKIKKYVLAGAITLTMVFVIKLIYAFTYVGDRTVLYPREEYTLSELLANKIMGYSEPLSVKELKAKNLVAEDRNIISKTKTNIEWSESKISNAANSELKENLDEIDTKYREDQDELSLNTYTGIRTKYINESDEEFKETLRLLLKTQLESDDYLLGWELKNPDSLLNEIIK